MSEMQTMKPVLIIKLGDTLPDLADRKGDFEDWFILDSRIIVTMKRKQVFKIDGLVKSRRQTST